MQALAQTTLLTVAVVWTMVFASLRKRRLVLRRPRRRCPSCGVVIAGRTCRRH